MANTVNNDNFKAEVLEASEAVLVDFYADWCGPCQGMLPVVNDMAENPMAGTKVVKVNIDDAPEIAQEFGVMSIPTFKVFKGGKVVGETMGGGKSREDLEALMKDHV